MTNDSNKIVLGVENSLPLIGDNYKELNLRKCQKLLTVIQHVLPTAGYSCHNNKIDRLTNLN